MKKPKYNPIQIAIALKEAETGTGVEKVYINGGISQATFYEPEKKQNRPEMFAPRRIRQPETVYARPKESKNEEN